MKKIFKDDNEKKAAKLTALTTLIVFLLMFFYKPLEAYDPPIEYGMEVNFGTTDFGSGEVEHWFCLKWPLKCIFWGRLGHYVLGKNSVKWYSAISLGCGTVPESEGEEGSDTMCPHPSFCRMFRACSGAIPWISMKSS